MRNPQTSHCLVALAVLGAAALVAGRSSAQPTPVRPVAVDMNHCCIATPNPDRRRLGRIVVAYPAQIPDARLDVFRPGETMPIATGYGDQAIDLLPGAYDVEISGARLAGVTVQSGNDTRIRVGAIAVRAPATTRVEILDAESGRSIVAAYGDKRFGLPIGEFALRVDSRTETIAITEEQITQH